MSDYTFQAFAGYGSDIHNYKIVISAAILLIWIMKLLMRYVKLNELLKGYRRKNIVSLDAHPDLEALLTRDIIVSFLNQQRQTVSSQCPRIVLPAHVRRLPPRISFEKSHVMITVTVDATEPCIVQAWVGVPISSITLQYNHYIHTRQGTNPSDPLVNPPSPPAPLLLQRAVGALSPMVLPAGQGQTVTLAVPRDDLHRALQHCNEHYPLVIYTNAGRGTVSPSFNGTGTSVTDLTVTGAYGDVTIVDMHTRDNESLRTYSTHGVTALQERTSTNSLEALVISEQAIAVSGMGAAGHYLVKSLPTFGVWEEGDSIECLVCMTEPRDIVFLPCRHICVCHSCRAPLATCPICRANIFAHTQFGGVAGVQPRGDESPVAADVIVATG